MTDSPKISVEEKIINEIKKGGFPLEMFSAITLNKRGWAVRPSLDYFDPQLGEFRETDIVAYKSSKTPEIFNILVIECKKLEKNPWVFIQQKRLGNLSENLNIATFQHHSVFYQKLEEKMNFHHYSKVPICTYSLVPFASEKDPNNRLAKSIYHAKNQILSSVSRLYNQREQMHKESGVYSGFTFIYPIIVFDGQLFSATIDEKDIRLSEENHLILSVEKELLKKRTIQLDHDLQQDQEYKPYFIDIIKKEYFEEFLELFENFYEEISESFSSCYEA
ncbi:hypothetical protein [Methanosphaerula subterraneus]|uniref:hypothetical protein n=1 Tax=Methanosphaerula subterraneus TaxID=3350244 RepID=UPI003F841164